MLGNDGLFVLLLLLLLSFRHILLRFGSLERHLKSQVSCLGILEVQRDRLRDLFLQGEGLSHGNIPDTHKVVASPVAETPNLNVENVFVNLPRELQLVAPLWGLVSFHCDCAGHRLVPESDCD